MTLDRDLHAAATQWLAQGLPAVVVEVIDARGSVPRQRGTRMLVSSARTLGTIGGGRLEWCAIERARELLAAGPASARIEHIPLGPALGQCCGGAVTLAWRLLTAEAMVAWSVAPPAMHLQLHGAGHVGQALATLLATLDIAVDWIDERDDAFAPVTTLGTAWPASIRRFAIDAPEGEVAHAPPGASFLVMTHQHDLDMRIVEAVLRRGDFHFLGLIGSRTKRARFEHRLLARGFTPAQVARIACPIGVEGIAGKQPEVIALAVAAQLVREVERPRMDASAGAPAISPSALPPRTTDPAAAVPPR